MEEDTGSFAASIGPSLTTFAQDDKRNAIKKKRRHNDYLSALGHSLCRLLFMSDAFVILSRAAAKDLSLRTSHVALDPKKLSPL
jgi:hypothetical protein